MAAQNSRKTINACARLQLCFRDSRLFVAVAIGNCGLLKTAGPAIACSKDTGPGLWDFILL